MSTQHFCKSWSDHQRMAVEVASSHLMQGKESSETKLNSRIFSDFFTGLLFALLADTFYRKFLISYLNCS